MTQTRNIVIGQVAPAPAHQPRVFEPLHPGADHVTLATSSTAATMPEYPVHRHRLPDSAARTSVSDGFGSASSNAIALSTIAGVQKPH